MAGAFAEINGSRLYYEVAGAADAPAVVLIHGFSLDTRLWDSQIGPFAERYRVVRYDLRGFGRSEPPVAGVAYQHETDVCGLLDRMGIERATLIGLSLGGAVALSVALRDPERVQALVLAASILPGFETPEFDAMTRPVWRAGRASGVDAARALWLDCPIFQVSNQQPATRAALRDMIADYSGWSWTDRDPGTWAEPDCVAQLGRITTPTLILVGDRDIADMRRTADALADGIPSARLAVMPGLGHLPNMEDPVAFNRVVLEFLTAVRAR